MEDDEVTSERSWVAQSGDSVRQTSTPVMVVVPGRPGSQPGSPLDPLAFYGAAMCVQPRADGGRCLLLTENRGVVAASGLEPPSAP